MNNPSVNRRFYRLRTPDANGSTTAISVRIDEDTGQLYLAVGAGSRRMYLTVLEGWTVWRCLSEALGSLGDPPPHIRTTIYPSRSSK